MQYWANVCDNFYGWARIRMGNLMPQWTKLFMGRRFWQTVSSVNPLARTYLLAKLTNFNAFRQPFITSSSKLCLKTMKLDTPEFRALFTDELEKLAVLFDKYNYELRIAGGAVRDLLMNKKPGDIDLASTATPDQMKEMFTTEGVRMINRKGEKHGTITARINDKENFEITTLRIDVVTDGRHAEVKFTTDWALDANRRDLTINSMFLGLDGTVYDYFDGIQDIRNRRVRFVGDPALRIQEDYLRILRYFRFYGKVAIEPDDHLRETLQAIEANVSGLAGISGERIWVELKKILTGNHVAYLFPQILKSGIAPYIGLPSDFDVDIFKSVYAMCQHLEPNPITILATLLKSEKDMKQLHDRMKFSAYERDLGYFIILNRGDMFHKTIPLRPYQILVLESKHSQSQVREWACEVFKYRGEEGRLQEFRDWVVPRFPVNGNMLRDKGVKPGRSFTLVINKLREHWIESDFTLTKDELLDKYLDDVLEQLSVNK